MQSLNTLLSMRYVCCIMIPLHLYLQQLENCNFGWMMLLLNKIVLLLIRLWYAFKNNQRSVVDLYDPSWIPPFTFQKTTHPHPSKNSNASIEDYIPYNIFAFNPPIITQRTKDFLQTTITMRDAKKKKLKKKQWSDNEREALAIALL